MQNIVKVFDFYISINHIERIYIDKEEEFVTMGMISGTRINFTPIKNQTLEELLEQIHSTLCKGQHEIISKIQNLPIYDGKK